jgi:hypothetical protein
MLTECTEESSVIEPKMYLHQPVATCVQQIGYPCRMIHIHLQSDVARVICNANSILTPPCLFLLVLVVETYEKNL